MASHLEPSSLDAAPHRAPSRRLGVARFRDQVRAIDELIYDYDPDGTGSTPEDSADAYEGVAVDVMRVLRDAEIGGDDKASAVREVVPRASHELIRRIVEAWDSN